MKRLALFIAAIAFIFAGCDTIDPTSTTDENATDGSLGTAHSHTSTSSTEVTTLTYGDFTLDGSAHWLPGTWDVTAGDVVVEYTADLSGAPNIANVGFSNFHAANVGLFNKANFSGAQMVGFLLDGDNSGTEFPSYPDLDGTLDLDDKFNAQAYSDGTVERSFGEAAYNVLCASNEVQSSAFGSGDNYGIWFDRDGVDQFQDDAWGAVDDGTYNTGGSYPVELSYRIASNASGSGTLCPVHAPEQPRVNDPDDGSGVPTGFDRQSDGSYADYPAGISWTPSSSSELAHMQGLVHGSSGNGTIEVMNVTITGPLVLEAGMGTGGGWFIPDPSTAVGITTDGSKATFGFNAKRKNGKSSGQLEFQYKTDDLNLKSTSYDWVNVTSAQVMFKGTGRLNGNDGYAFRVRGVDGDQNTGTDRFEIRIWTGSGDFDSPTYRAEGDLGGGQIVVHNR